MIREANASSLSWGRQFDYGAATEGCIYPQRTFFQRLQLQFNRFVLLRITLLGSRTILRALLCRVPIVDYGTGCANRRCLLKLEREGISSSVSRTIPNS